MSIITVLCQTVKRIIWFPIKDKQHNSKLGAIKLREPCKAQHLQLCNFVHSVCRLVIIELMQQCQEMNLVQMTKTCERILKKRQLSCKGIAQDIRIYSGLIVDRIIWSSLFFAVFVFRFIFSTIVKIFRYFSDRNILGVKSPPFSGRTGNLLPTISGTFCVFPVNHLSANLITAQRRDFNHQYSPSMNFYVF